MLMKKSIVELVTILVLVIILLFSFSGNKIKANNSFKKIENYVKEIMKDAKIPGLSVAIVNGNKVYLKGFGYKNLEKEKEVTPKTKFEVGSLSKAFTSLGILLLEEKNSIDLEDNVSNYLPWFHATYKGKKVDITIEQLLHHTSGIPEETIAQIPQGSDEQALKKTVKKISGVNLNHLPGEKFEYATINYDITGAIIEEVTGTIFKTYMQENIFQNLGLDSTKVGVQGNINSMATGYKIGFFQPRRYEPPILRGNNPSGYIVSNAEDMVKWLKYQIGLLDTDLSNLIKASQNPNRTVPPNEFDGSSYAKGWYVYQQDSGKLSHAGRNPNYTSYMSFMPEKKIGVVVLANSNSKYTNIIGENLMNILSKGRIEKKPAPNNTVDKFSSIVSFVMIIYLIAAIVFFIIAVIDLIKNKREIKEISFREIVYLGIGLLVNIPFVIGIYLIPQVIANADWQTAIVWTPVSFPVAIILILISLGVTYLIYCVCLLCPKKKKKYDSLPLVIVLALFSGLANGFIIYLITNAVVIDVSIYYLVYYFGLAFCLYIIGRKVVETKLINITYDIIYNKRLDLFDKIFSTSYENFECIDTGRVYAVLNDDTEQVGNVTSALVTFVTNFITVIFAFVYLAVISLSATVLTAGIIFIIAFIYYIVTQKTRIYWKKARDTRNYFMDLLDGLVKGYKELSLHYKKKVEYKEDLEEVCCKYKTKMNKARVKFVNAFLVGESMLLVVLGVASFGLPKLVFGIETHEIMIFIMVLLYLIGPINGILNVIPDIMEAKVSWDRIQKLIKEIPSNRNRKLDVHKKKEFKNINMIKAENLMFEYNTEEDSFSLGPIDLEVKSGEVFFITGGNGSGKTTLVKLLTGLYTPNNGIIKINGKKIKNNKLSEYMSVVFNDFHLFKKLYNIDYTSKQLQIEKYLNLLELDKKVEIENGKFSTINLSGGQRKRLALLKCFLEDNSIFIFDEWAADQDPEFKEIFYTDLLSKMKQAGKIIIAITHDDHYFNVADKIIKMNRGRIKLVKS